MVSLLGPLFRTAGHTVRNQHGVTASAGPTALRRGDSELPVSETGWQPELGLRPQRHTWFGSSGHPQQNGLLTMLRT
jgi:hypothetical protein